MESKKAILLFGPTASGKSRLALDIAKRFNGEIVNADSMQVYKEVKILSARPDEKVPKHHLYGFISIKEDFSVGAWYKLVTKKINDINRRRKLALIVGGTGLYFKALTEGLVEIPKVPKKDYSHLNHHDQFFLKNRYKKKYKEIFKDIDINDTQRALRALAVYEHTGITLSDWQKNKNKKYFNRDDFIKICLVPPKIELEKRIKKRFIDMLKNGAIDEVKKYMKKQSLNSKNTSNSIIGIKEIKDYLDYKISIKLAKELIKQKTRQYAKRQFTWARGHMKSWKMIYSSDLNDLFKKSINKIS